MSKPWGNFLYTFTSDCDILCIDAPGWADPGKQPNMIAGVFLSNGDTGPTENEEWLPAFVLLFYQKRKELCYLAEKLKIKSPYIVVEGIATTEEISVDSVKADALKNEKYIFLNYSCNCGICQLQHRNHREQG